MRQFAIAGQLFTAIAYIAIVATHSASISKVDIIGLLLAFLLIWASVYDLQNHEKR